MFPEVVETDSLELRRQSPDEADPFALYGTFGVGEPTAEGVFAYVPQEPYDTAKEATDAIAGADEAWDDHGAALYAVYASGSTFAGVAGLSVDWDRTGEPGVVLARPFWGNGYAGECAEALTELAFERLDLDLVAIGYEDGNERSKRVVEAHVDRFGGQYEGRLRNRTPIGDEVADHHRYTIDREEYEPASADGSGPP